MSALIKEEQTELKSILDEASQYVAQLFEAQQLEKYAFHNFKFIADMVEEAQKIANAVIADQAEREVVLLAAWFVYSGYAKGYPAIAEKSQSIASRFLSERGYPSEQAQQVLDCMSCLHSANKPQSPGQAVLHDAAIAYMGKRKFRKKSKLLREELEALGNEEFTETEWVNFLIGLLSSSRFSTDFAKVEYAVRFEQNMFDLNVEHREGVEKAETLKGTRVLEKGVDTLFRTQSRYLTTLVGLADRKAQMMIGVNSITLSIVVASFESHLSSRSWLLLPVGILISVNLITTIFAIMVIRPTAPKAETVKPEDVLLKHGYLMSQVIFADIKYEDFKLGIRQMMSDETYLYDTLIQGLYGTGRVLQKKFRNLKLAYTIFISGIIAAVVSFIGVVLFTHPFS